MKLSRIFGRTGYSALIAAAIVAGVVSMGVAANITLSTGAHFVPTGPALTKGSDLNTMVDAINVLRKQAAGTTTGTYTGTFNGTVGATTPSTGAFTTVAVSGAITPTGGVAAAAGGSVSPRLVSTCGIPVQVSTGGADGTPSVTEQYMAEVFVPANMSVTGVNVFNGSATGSGNIQISMYTAAGAVITAAQTASTALVGTDTAQLIPFAAPWAAKGPATYYVASQYNNTATHFNFHVLAGSCGAGKVTGTTYGTFAAQTMPTTFTTALGPIASLY